MDLLTRLKADFIFTHQMDYFTEKEIMQIIDRAYCLGLDEAQKRHTTTVIRYLGNNEVKYESAVVAGAINRTNPNNIFKAIKRGNKCVGYYWKRA